MSVQNRVQFKSNGSGIMAELDPRTGYCNRTKTFYSLRPPVPLPPHTTALSASSYALSLQPTSPFANAVALIDSVSGHQISSSQFRQYVQALAFSLRNILGLSRSDVAFVLSPNSTRLPLLYLSLLSLGVSVCPANPLSASYEISHQLALSKPTIAFVTTATKGKLAQSGIRTVLIDTDEFESMLTQKVPISDIEMIDSVEISQDDVAAILFSSGTTGQVKGVMLTHRNFVAITAAFYYHRQKRESPAVVLLTVPYFHVFGFVYILKCVALNEAVVVMERYELGRMLKAVEDYKVTHLAVVPPIVVSMVKSDSSMNFDLGSLEAVGCGAAPLGKDVIQAFLKKFQGVTLYQAYGMTETSGSTFKSVSPEESLRWGSVGKLHRNCAAKIVDPETGFPLPPGKKGELWVKGPTIMKGYINDPKANSDTLLTDGWLKTGDICYIDDEGFLFVVDRLKELIKYKGYQVPPAELEQLLHSHPDIVDAAVIPFPDEETGQIPLAFAVRRSQSSLDEGQIIDLIANQVAPYKKVRRVVFVDSIPKSPSGKILRKELKKMIQIPRSKL